MQPLAISKLVVLGGYFYKFGFYNFFYRSEVGVLHLLPIFIFYPEKHKSLIGIPRNMEGGGFTDFLQIFHPFVSC